MKQKIIDKINRLASQKEPFLFVINYQADEAFIRKLSDINPEECLFDFEGKGNLEQLDEVAEKALNDGSIIYNPKEASLKDLKAILEKAW
jgi:alcohol dehydrogenase class IV